MDNQTPNPTQTPPANPVSQASSTQAVPSPQPIQSPPPANKPFIPLRILLTVLAVLIILTIGTGTFAILNSNSSKAQPSPTPAITSTPTPIPNPTADWKTIIFLQEGFSFKYPPNLLFPEYPRECYENNQYGKFWFRANLDESAQLNKDGSYYKNCIVPGEDGNQFEITISESVTAPRVGQSKQIKIADQNATILFDRGKLGGEGGHLISFSRNKKNYSIHIPEEKSLENGGIDPLFMQILSTFKFTDEQVACTQDAKLCPDGKTYVSREGPNCEFAPCPGN